MSNNHIWNFNSNKEGRSIWQLVSKAGDLIGQSSQSFSSKAGAEYNAKLMGYNGNFSKQLVWEFLETNGKWSWACHNSVNKENVGKSINSFESEIACMDNAINFGFDPKNYKMRTVAASDEVVVESKAVNSFASVETPKVTVDAALPKTDIEYVAPKITVESPKTNIDLGKVAATAGVVGATVAGPAVAKTVTSVSSVNVSTPKVSTANADINVLEEDGGFGGFWRWLWPLLLLALLLGLLWWWFSGMNKPSVNVDNSQSKVSTPTLSTPKIGNIFKSINKPDFSTLSTALRASGLEGAVNGLGPLTLLAPTNSAFSALPDGTVAGLLQADKLTALQNLLKAHVIPGDIDLTKVKDGEMVKTLAGEFKASVADGKLSLGGVEGIELSANSKEDGVTTFGIPGVILEVPVTDATAGDKKMEESIATSTTAAMEKSMDKTNNFKNGQFLAAANADGRFTTLISLVKQAGLEGALEGTGPFTIFAPTDEAFATLGSDTLATLQKPENKDKLASILKYHVVSGKNTFEEFSKNKELVTLNGGKILLSLDIHGNGLVKGLKNDGLAPVADIDTENAIIHVITDTVMMPN
jgi:transforming growth factor-beta-induced protein